MSFLHSYWSVENINHLYFTPNESKVVRSEKNANLRLTPGPTNNHVSRVPNTGNEIGFIKRMSREHIPQTFNAYLLFSCPTPSPPPPPKAHNSQFYLKLRVLLSPESNENFDEHCAQLTIKYRQNQVTARRIPVSKTMILFKPMQKWNRTKALSI